MFEAVYNFINLVFSWFAIANFYIFFVILTTSLEDKSFNIKGINVLNVMCQVSRSIGDAVVLLRH